MTAPWTQWQQWELVEKIGQGSYGAVYKAAKKTADGEALSAIKVISIPPSEAEVYSIKAEGYNAEQARVYFKTIAEDYINECRVMQSLKESANVVAIEDYYMSEKADGIGFDIFMRMELLTPLTTYLEENAVDEMMVAKLGSDICAALDTCAGHNIIHRDIKPDNIFLDAQGNFKLGDFGIARRMDSLSGNLTKIGTENYMAPEIFMGGQYDSRVDLYSLGLVMYALLNDRKLPFWPKDKQIISARERHEAFSRRMSGEKLPIPEKCSAKMAETILKACALKPENRFASAAEMKEKLHRISAPAPVKKKESKRSNRWRAPLIACIVLLLFGLLIGGIAAFVGNNTTPTPPAIETPDEPSAGDIDLPVTPTMPNEPSTPDDPSQPIMPNEPSPSEPNTPTTPTEPNEPEVPTQPTEPTEPEVPTQPTEPTPHTHIWDNGSITLAATCKDAGVKTYTCSDCGSTKTESIAKLTTHAYDNGTVSGTVKTYTCTVCGEIKTETVQSPEPTTPTTPIEPNEPEPNEPEPTVPSTPDEPVTPDTPDEPTVEPEEPATPETPDEPTTHTHSWDNGSITLAATCKDAGVKTYTCSDCGSTKTESIAKLTTHAYDNGTVSGNIKTYTCTVCGTTKTETVNPTQPDTSIYTYTTTYGVATITGVNTSISGDITIPATLGGYPVTSIGSNAFRECSSLTSVTIPDSVTSIGDSAFIDCSSLTSITIPDDVTSIGIAVFNNCNSLASITVAKGNTVYKDIDGVLFTADGMTLVRYPEAKSGTSYSIDSGVTSIGRSAFHNCSSLTSVTIHDSVTSIGYGAFSGCSNLTGINIPDGVPTIEDFAFSGCSSLTSITIPDSVTSISLYAFSGCSGLTSVDLGNGVALIEGSAFSGCTGLTSIIIPDNVTCISGMAFMGCSNLTIYCEAAARPSDWDFDWNSYSPNVSDKCPVVWGYSASSEPDTSMYTYSVTDGKATITKVDTAISGDITIPTTLGGYPVTAIGEEAFYNCKEITGVSIPNSVTSIGQRAFCDCRGLVSANIPEGVTSIGYQAFALTKITEAIIPDSVVDLGDEAFYCCDKVTNLSIGKGINAIGTATFFGCDGLTSVTIPDNITAIGADAFALCTSLVSVELPYGMEIIGDEAFMHCSQLTSINIPNSVMTIGEKAFSECYELTSITIPESVTSIGYYAFNDCENLTIYAEVASKPAGWSQNWNPYDCHVVWKEESLI